MWHADRAALFAADHNNRTSVKGDHLFSWQVGLLIGLLMLCEWAGDRSQTNGQIKTQTGKPAGWSWVTHTHTDKIHTGTDVQDNKYN